MIKGKAIFGNHSDKINEQITELCKNEKPKAILSQSAKLITDLSNQPLMLVVVFYEV